VIKNQFQFKDQKDWPQIKNWLQKRSRPDVNVDQQVREILDNVEEKGDAALIEYTRRFDAPDFAPENLKVNNKEIEKGLAEVPESDLAIIREASERIRAFHEKQKQKSWYDLAEDGTILGQIYTPVERAGLYVPGGMGGETPLISSLLMNAIPAIVAGVKEIILVSPPRKDGSLNPYILATAHILGLNKIYKIGSAWAIAALAFGTQSVPAVDVIAGPGNIYVTTAKRLVAGLVGIDMIAGPSEVTILADDSARPDFLAADLLSQAEHDPLAACILVTSCQELIPEVTSALKEQLSTLPRNEIAGTSLKDWGAFILVDDIKKGLEVVNLIAPEHFELCIRDPWSVLGQVKNAGAIFMGHFSPEPVGDYFAGPNHVLPTMSTARFSSALSVDTFYKKSSVIYTNEKYIQQHGSKIARLARLEGLEAHARSVLIRQQHTTTHH